MDSESNSNIFSLCYSIRPSEISMLKEKEVYKTTKHSFICKRWPKRKPTKTWKLYKTVWCIFLFALCTIFYKIRKNKWWEKNKTWICLKNNIQGSLLRPVLFIHVRKVEACLENMLSTLEMDNAGNDCNYTGHYETE